MRWFLSGAVLGFLAVQAAYPLSTLRVGAADTRDGFTRSMYSDSYVCSARYELRMWDGNRVDLPIVSYSNQPELGPASIRRVIVPAFRDWMCSRFTTGAEIARVYGKIRCRTELERFETTVLPDLCLAETREAI